MNIENCPIANLKFWEDRIESNVKSFEKRFCQGKELMGVYWCSENMQVKYMLSNNNIENECFAEIPVIDCFEMEKFLDWLNTN